MKRVTTQFFFNAHTCNTVHRRTHSNLQTIHGAATHTHTPVNLYCTKHKFLRPNAKYMPFRETIYVCMYVCVCHKCIFKQHFLFLFLPSVRSAPTLLRCDTARRSALLWQSYSAEIIINSNATFTHDEDAYFELQQYYYIHTCAAAQAHLIDSRCRDISTKQIALTSAGTCYFTSNSITAVALAK